MGVKYRILVRTQQDTTETALVDKQGALLEIYRTPMAEKSMVGSIIVGRTERVLPDIGAAFVEIGQASNGFLPLSENESFSRSSYATPLITGNSVLVQVKKAPKGKKGAFLTRDIVLPGQYILLLPCSDYIGLSKRITLPEDRKRAQSLGSYISKQRFGVIVRHAALFAPIQEVADEAETLYAQWQTIMKQAAAFRPPAVLFREQEIPGILERDYSARHSIETVSVSSADGEDELDRLWKKYSIDRQKNEALGRIVPFSGGGTLIIDEREALQTIDVNSGSAVFSESASSFALEENLKAVPAIASQIRLRNLSGIILVDFIDMRTEEERAQVRMALSEAVSDDRTKTVIHEFTSLGLLELTRKRTGPSLRDMYMCPCPHCHESGYLIL